MSEVRLVVREAERDWSGTVHGSDADRAIASLSADPTTLDELEAASERFAQKSGGRFLGNLREDLCDEPYDAGLVVIDLPARLVVFDSTYSAPSASGHIDYHDGVSETDRDVSYHLAGDWLFSSGAASWKSLAEHRRRERAARPPLDARAVLYGRPLLEFLARGAFEAFGRRDRIAAEARQRRLESDRRFAREADRPSRDIDAAPLTDEQLFYDALSKIHAAWLLTPRADLQGRCPREIALERRGHLSWDLEDRSRQWSEFGRCPRGLDETSFAYRYAGFGTHELVVYYELVRELLRFAWSDLTRAADTAEGRTAGDFLADEIPRMERFREAWLDSPHIEFHGRPPRSIIERERRRLPEGMSGHEAMVDPDCPCCQMLADMPGPTFWHLDGSAMDEDFAFDIYHPTREEWEAEQREMDENIREWERKRVERERLGVADRTETTWSRTFVSEDADVPLGIRLFGIGCRLAELIVALRGGAAPGDVPPPIRAEIERLNRHFGNLREILDGSDASRFAALVEPVLDRFAETLAEVGDVHPECAPQCAALADDCRKLLFPPSADSDDEIDPIPF